MLSVTDIFKIGIGPSSSHTLGPMKIGRRFLLEAETAGHLENSAAVVVDLHGSLSLTGVGHCTDRASVLGLMGEEAETIKTSTVDQRLTEVREKKSLSLLGKHDNLHTNRDFSSALQSSRSTQGRLDKD